MPLPYDQDISIDMTRRATEWDQSSISTTSLLGRYSLSDPNRPTSSTCSSATVTCNDSASQRLIIPRQPFFHQRALDDHASGPFTRRALQQLEQRRQALRAEYRPARWSAARRARLAPCRHAYCADRRCLSRVWEDADRDKEDGRQRVYGAQRAAAPVWGNERDGGQGPIKLGLFPTPFPLQERRPSKRRPFSGALGRSATTWLRSLGSAAAAPEEELLPPPPYSVVCEGGNAKRKSRA